LLSGEAYTASAFAIEETDICYIPKETFFTILEENNTLSMQVMKRLATDLKTAEEKIINLAQKPVRERLAEALLFLKNVYGIEEDQKTIKVVMKREEIANIAGTSVESTIRTLSEFNKEKLIKIEGKRIKILNLKELLFTANILD
jgi:CRP/FNR family transcriptional regulator, polysaccharide utilization system transcription regulator